MSSTNELIRYPAMILAIAECREVDEVKDIRDKAIAFQHYFKQAKNRDAERQAVEIRIRAERKTGQLLREMEKVPVGRPVKQSPQNGGNKNIYKDVLRETSLSTQESSRFQQLANIPDEEFEERLKKADPISAREMVDPPQLPPFHAPQSTMFVWGWFTYFEKNLIERDPAIVFAEMAVTMQEDIHRLSPAFVEWMTKLRKAACHDDDQSH